MGHGTSMVPRGSPAHGYQHGSRRQHRPLNPRGPWWQHGSWASTWLQAQTEDIDVGFGGNTGIAHSIAPTFTLVLGIQTQDLILVRKVLCPLSLA